MNQEKELKSLIEKSEVVDFAPFGEGVSNLWINKTESKLGLELPQSYKWWLLNYAGGEVANMEIFSIYEIDDIVGGDIAYMSKINEKNLGISVKEKLYILETGHHQAYFDTTEMTNNEYKVVEIIEEKKEIHSNFIQFLISLIESNE